MGIKRGIFYVLVANLINLFVGLFAGFVLPKMLSVETYSDIRLFQLYITYLGILHFGYSDGMYLRHGGKSVDMIDKKEVLAEFKTFKIFQLVISVLAIVVSLILQNKILLFCSLVVLPVNVGNYLRNLYQATGEFKKYSRFTNINTLMIFIINVILLFIVKSDNSVIYIISYVVAYFVYWLLIEIENRKIFGKEPTRPNREYLRSDVKTGFFLMTGNFCNVIFTSIDRLFVKFFLGKIKFAFYSFAVSVENLANVFINPISTVMYNYLCKNRGQEQVRMLKRTVLAFGAALLLMVYPAKFVIQHWLTNYSEAIMVLFLLFAAQFVSIIVRCVHINLYKSYKQQNKYFVIMVIIVALSVGLNLMFFNILNTMESIAFATLMTTIVWLVIGEIDLRYYMLKIREYIYIALILGVFLSTMLIESAIIGLAVYLGVLVVMTLALLPSVPGFCIEETKKTLGKLRKNGKN